MDGTRNFANILAPSADVFYNLSRDRSAADGEISAEIAGDPDLSLEARIRFRNLTACAAGGGAIYDYCSSNGHTVTIGGLANGSFDSSKVALKLWVEWEAAGLAGRVIAAPLKVLFGGIRAARAARTAELLVESERAAGRPLEGVRDYQVMDPSNAGRTITDIDLVQNGTLWEQKSASSAINPRAWIAKHIDKKFASYLEARQYLPGYENAPIGFDFTSPMTPGFQTQVRSAILALRQENPQVPILMRFNQ